VWSHIKPCLQAASDDPTRFTGVQVLGVDEHVWHHQDRRRRGPRELTGIVDLTRGKDHPTARLLDLIPGRSGTVYKNWLAERGEQFRSGIQIATLDPFQGYKNAIDDQLQDATSVLDAFHIVKLAADALDEVCRHVQQDTLGHRGRKGDPLYQIRLLLRASRRRLTPRQKESLREALVADEAHISVEVAYLLTQQVREVFHQATPGQGRRLATHLIERLPTCPMPEIARLGRTLRKWKDAFLAYFDTGGASNGPTEAINGHYRTRQTHRQRLPQPHQPQTPNAPHRRRPRRLHPHSTLKSHIANSLVPRDQSWAEEPHLVSQYSEIFDPLLVRHNVASARIAARRQHHDRRGAS